MEQKLIITKGLPASGKSTWAKEQVSKDPENVVRVNKDDLRAMINASKWSKGREKHIELMQEITVKHYLNLGFNVIVDNTHLVPKWTTYFKELAEDFNVKFEIKDFTHISIDTCIERNELREAKVPVRTIRDMYNMYVRKAPVYEDSDYVICDIDGTLAHMEGRSPYDPTKILEDKVDVPIKRLLKMINEDIRVIFVSGRDSMCREDTVKWITDAIGYCPELYMRKTKDNRKDSDVKKEIYLEELKPKYGKPLFILDDRDRVVKMWRELGLKCLQCEYGNF